MSTFSERKYNKVVWAFNPFDRESENDENAAVLLRHFEKLEDYELHPIFVFSPRYFLHPELEFEKSRPAAEIFPMLRMKERIHALNLKNVKEPRVLRCSKPSVRQEVSIFLKALEEIQPSFVLMSPHEKSFWARFAAGSFSDLILRKSSIPLLMTSTNMTAPDRIRNIFYPTDFGINAIAGLFRSFDLAKIFGAKVIVYHSTWPEKLSARYSEYNFFGVDAWPTYIAQKSGAYIEDRKQEFISEAKRQEMEIEIIIEEAAVSVATAISKKMEQLQPDFIVTMARHHGILFDSVGSTVQSVVKKSECPIYVFHMKETESETE